MWRGCLEWKLPFKQCHWEGSGQGGGMRAEALDRAPIFQEACKAQNASIFRTSLEVKAQQNFAMDRGRILSSRPFGVVGLLRVCHSTAHVAGIVASCVLSLNLWTALQGLA